MPDRKQAPPIIDAVEFDLRLKQVERYTLRNGIEVYAINAGAEEVMSIELIFNAGNWYEQKNLVAASANFLLRNGTSKRSAFQINEHFEYYGSYLNRACYNETATITLHCLNKHIQELLPVVKELIVDSVMPEPELATYKQNMQQRLKVSVRKCDFVASRLIDTYLFGVDHPYGKYSTVEGFDSLTRDELMDFYKEYYQNGKVVIFAAGKLPSDLAAQLDKWLGDLPNQEKAMPMIQPIRAGEKKYRVMNNEEGVQGAIRMARTFPNRHHPDFMKVMVLNTLFGGFFGSRLMSNIREDKGYTYGIHSFLMNHVHESGWGISTEAGKEVCEAAITEVYKEMALLREELVDEEELLLVQNYMLGGILGDLDGPFQIISRWKNIVLNGLTEQYFYDTIQTIKTISAEDLKELANKYLQPEEFYELVVV